MPTLFPYTTLFRSGTVTMLEVLDAYQQAEQLRLQRHEQEFNAREAVAETNLVFGRIQ